MNPEDKHYSEAVREAAQPEKKAPKPPSMLSALRRQMTLLMAGAQTRAPKRAHPGARARTKPRGDGSGRHNRPANGKWDWQKNERGEPTHIWLTARPRAAAKKVRRKSLPSGLPPRKKMGRSTTRSHKQIVRKNYRNIMRRVRVQPPESR